MEGRGQKDRKHSSLRQTIANGEPHFDTASISLERQKHDTEGRAIVRVVNKRLDSRRYVVTVEEVAVERSLRTVVDWWG